MLTQLKIGNYALIAHLDITPSSGLNIITGETGAGKSIMLGAVGLLLGNRADTKILSNTEEKCIIEGVFDITSYGLNTFFEEEDLDYDAHTIIRRELSPSGKSRAFVNDTPVNLEVLKKLSTYLIDVHSQHESLMLAEHSFQYHLIDHFAGNTDLLMSYQKTYKEYVELQKTVKYVESQIADFQKEHDYHQFLLEELSEIKLEDGEQELLEEELSMLDNAEEIKSGLYTVGHLLSNGEQTVENYLQEAKNTLKKLQELSPKYEQLYQRVNSAAIELQDIAREVDTVTDGVIYDPERVETVRERLGEIYRLQQKHQVSSVGELMDIEKKLSLKVLKTGELEEQLINLKSNLLTTKNNVYRLGGNLLESRKNVFASLQQKLEGLLHEVGMPDASIEIKVVSEHVKPSVSGLDEIAILFSANKGIDPAPISKVASGGELSRLMFCAKFILADKTALPTVIFDEIDAGISGEVAMKMGRMMLLMSKSHQVITITHLPQIAALADSHYYVYKDESKGKTISGVKVLDQGQKLEEVAKMIGGDNPSKAAISSARELIG